MQRQDAHWPWVQPIVVLKTGTHEGTIEAAAQASLAVGLRDLTEAEDAVVREWLSGPFTKTVRRASPSQMERVLAWANTTGQAMSQVKREDSSALALLPTKYDDMPTSLSKLQVSGTDFTRSAQPDSSYDLVLHVLDSLTTGKAAAQAAHAAWLYHLNGDASHTAEPRVRVKLENSERLLELAQASPHLAVRDNGLTEVEPQTLTAVAGANSE